MDPSGDFPVLPGMVWFWNNLSWNTMLILNVFPSTFTVFGKECAKLNYHAI